MFESQPHITYIYWQNPQVYIVFVLYMHYMFVLTFVMFSLCLVDAVPLSMCADKYDMN